MSRLRIVSINDVYELTHLSRIRTMMQKLSHGSNTMISVIAGDFVSPSVLSSFDSGKGMVDCLNRLPITHACFGNHEADIGLPELKKRIHEFNGVWLNSNLRNLKHPRLREYDIVTLPCGRRVGFIGLLLDGKIGLKVGDFKGIPVDPVIQTATKLCQHLRAVEKVDLVVPITHQGIQEDIQLASSGLGFPLLLGGHDHEPYLHEVHGCRIVKSGTNAIHATICDIDFPPPSSFQANVPIDLSGAASGGGGGSSSSSGSQTAAASAGVRVSARLEAAERYAADGELEARAAEHMDVVRALEKEPACWVAPSQTRLLPFSSQGSRLRQTTVGALFCDAARRVLRTDGAIINGGSIAGNRTYPQPRMSLLELRRELPYPTKMIAAHLPGRILAEAILHSRRHGPGPERRGYLQVDSGMAVDAEDRLTHVAAQPFDPARLYSVALPRNLLAGFCEIQPLLDYAAAHPEAAAAAASGPGGVDNFIPALNVVVSSFALRIWAGLGDFAQLDCDGSGGIDRRELAAAVRARLGAEPSQVMLDNLMAAVDTNRDGMVDLAELAAAAAAAGAPDPDLAPVR